MLHEDADVCFDLKVQRALWRPGSHCQLGHFDISTELSVPVIIAVPGPVTVGPLGFSSRTDVLDKRLMTFLFLKKSQIKSNENVLILFICLNCN